MDPTKVASVTDWPTPTLIKEHPDLSEPFIVEVDASESGIEAVLSQWFGDKAKLHPVAYSKKLSPVWPWKSEIIGCETWIREVVSLFGSSQSIHDLHIPQKSWIPENCQMPGLIPSLVGSVICPT